MLLSENRGRKTFDDPRVSDGNRTRAKPVVSPLQTRSTTVIDEDFDPKLGTTFQAQTAIKATVTSLKA